MHGALTQSASVRSRVHSDGLAGAKLRNGPCPLQFTTAVPTMQTGYLFSQQYSAVKETDVKILPDAQLPSAEQLH